MFCSERHCAASWRCSLDTIRPKPECSLLDSGSGSGVGQVNNLRADCQSAQMARVNNPRAGWHPAPQAKRITLGLAVAAGLSGAVFDWNLPKGFPRPAIPADNPMSAVKVELGRYLFYDGRMSVNGKESCGTCPSSGTCIHRWPQPRPRYYRPTSSAWQHEPGERRSEESRV